MEGVKVGIPHSLYYYLFGPLWETFFQQLGADVIVSSPTTKEIVDEGVKEAVTDACVPIKVFHGHIMSLAEQSVDYLFIPRLIHWNDTDTFCPKFLGLPDMIRHGIKGIPEVVSPRISAKYPWSSIRPCLEMAKKFGVSFGKALLAYQRGLSVWRRYRNLLQDGWMPKEARQILQGKTLQQRTGELTIALLGYPYTIYDNYLSTGLLKKLDELKVNFRTAEMLPRRIIKGARYDDKPAFWHFSDKLLRAGILSLQDNSIVGIIHVTAFGCGPDFLVNKILELEAKSHQMPFLTLSIDEQSGEAGLVTRVEAFVDMLRIKQKEGKTSAS